MRRLFFAGLTLIIFLFPNCTFGTEIFKVKQAIGQGQDATYYWFHNGRYWSSEFLYQPGMKPWLMPGIGPVFVAKIGTIGLKIFGYIGIMLDVSKNKWPIKTVEIDSFIIPTLNQWSLYIRSAAEVDPRRESTAWYWGRDFVGYQVNDWQIRAQTEWQYRDGHFLQSIGFGWSRKITPNFSFDGYLGFETEKPHTKVGWLEVKSSFK